MWASISTIARSKDISVHKLCKVFAHILGFKILKHFLLAKYSKKITLVDQLTNYLSFNKQRCSSHLYALSDP